MQSTGQRPATLPNGRRITPVGEWTEVAPFPFSLTLSPDGKELVAASLGFPFALNIIADPAGANRAVTQLPQGYLSRPEVEVYTGIAYSSDGKLLFVSTGESGAIDILSTSDWHKIGRINLNGASGGHMYRDSFGAGMVISADGHTLYVIDQANWRVVAIDTRPG